MTSSDGGRAVVVVLVWRVIRYGMGLEKGRLSLVLKASFEVAIAPVFILVLLFSDKRPVVTERMFAAVRVSPEGCLFCSGSGLAVPYSGSLRNCEAASTKRFWSG